MDLLVGGWSERIKRGGRRLIMLTNSNTEGEFYPPKRRNAAVDGKTAKKGDLSGLYKTHW
jgi:hypothetical protein